MAETLTDDVLKDEIAVSLPLQWQLGRKMI